MFNILRPLSIIAAATFVLVVFGSALGTFGATTALGMVGLSIGLSVVALIALAMVTFAVCLPLRIESPGMLLHSIFGVIAGTLTLWIFSMLVPNFVHMASFVEAIPYATANTFLIWMLGFATGATKLKQPVMPVFKRK